MHMKPVLALLLLFSSLQSLQAQYQPFDLDSGRWYAFYSTKGGRFGGGHVSSNYVRDSVKFYCEGDTIINAITYKKLMYVGNTESQTVPLSPISGYYGAIRNDVPNKKVYFVTLNGTEFTLYNFNLNIGDTIPETVIFSNPEPVSHIDSVLYCSAYHKRYHTASGYYVIEGVGSEHGMFPVKWATSYGWLMCYQEFGNGACVDCNIPLSLDSHEQHKLTVFPNPATASVQIESTQPVRSVDVFDLKGKLVEHVEHWQGAIDLKNQGSYILKITTNSGIFVRKLVIH